VGSLAHRFGPSRQDHFRLAEDNLLGGLGHRLESRAAEPVDRYRRSLDGSARAKPDMSSEVDRVG
jgi:hypothetical protein